MVYHKSDYLRIAILAIVYALLAKLVLAFFAANGVISLIWPLSGLAITCLLVGGNKYWPGIFIGALAGNYMSGNPVDVSFAIATGNTLEALLCTFLLTRTNHFNDKFEHIIDFFMLGFAASVSACVAALIGVSALVLKGISTQQELFANLIYWWQGDVLGILLLSPLLLVWRQLPRGWFKRERVLETIACFGLAFLAGQIVFLGWFHDFFGITARGFWVFIFVVWSAVRFGRHGVLLTLALTALQMLIGTVLQAEGFAQNLVPTGMLNFWFYMIALTLTGVSLALVIEGRERAEAAIKQTDIIFNKLSQQVPGVIYQFRLYPDGRSCFPFASEAIQDIYEVTPEQVREDASAVFAILHPEDYDSVVASIQHSAQTLTRWRHEYRVVLPRQGVCWRLGESDPEKLEDGSVVWYGFISDISERKKAEGDIYQSESILSATINSSLDAVVHMDAEGVITRWSAQAEKTFGWTRAEAIGQKLEETIIPQRYREAHVRGMKHFLASGEGPVLNSRIELSALHRDGHELPVELSITPLKIADKYHFSAFIRDITRRRRSDERIERLKHLYQALSEVNQAIVRMENQDELFPLVCRCAVEFGGMKMAWIGQLDEASSLVAPVASYGSGLEYLDGIVVSSSAEVPEGRGPIGTAMRENKPIVVNDYFASPLTLPWQKKADIYGWNSAAAFPILRGGQQFGVLSVYHSQTNAFDAETIALLTEMSTDIAFALDNFDRKVQRKYDEESLQLAASIYETSSEAMMVMDAESRVLAINPAFTTITGYLEEEALGQSLDTFKSNHHDEAFYQAIRDEINNTGKWQGEIWARRKNGEVYPTLVVINTIYNKDGSVLRRVWLFNDISKRKETEEFIWRQANYDLLTGLPNRRMFQDRVEQEFKKVHRANLPLVLLFLDLDYFKEVNDTLGHATGDMLLKEAAQRIAGCVRESDTVARFGGDEFTILLSDLDDNDTVNRVIQSILQALLKPFKLNDETVYLTASIGVTCYPDDGLEIETLIKNADQAMYAAKAAGRNGYSYFTPTMQAVAQARMKLANDLRSAMQENQFWVAYQPILDLKSGKIIKAEALVRWQHPKLGLVSPAEFIPVAEHTGLINDIGEFVFLQATQQVRRWQELYDNEFQISVNVSPVQFNDKSGKYKTWRQQLKSLGLSGKSIVVEITEGLLLEASDLIKEKLIEYRDAGIQVALDDFGTGYSSLSYLKKFDIDYIKIDQSFVRNLSPSSGELALCEAMIVMAHKLGMTVIAEGVETLEQRDLLTEIGCDYAQGYLFSRPLPMDEFEKFLLNT